MKKSIMPALWMLLLAITTPYAQPGRLRFERLSLEQGLSQSSVFCAFQDRRVEGLETGADDYLTKPFDPRELRVRVRNLIEGRQKLREQFGRQVTLEPKAIAITSADEKFLARAVEAVERHLGDPDFSVERFEEAMTMSKLQLYRTLKALTDQLPSEFIRNLRLKRAAALLAARSGSVAEITYAVGFNNPSYFAKCFRAAYGVSPSEYANGGAAVEK